LVGVIPDLRQHLRAKRAAELAAQPSDGG